MLVDDLVILEKTSFVDFNLKILLNMQGLNYDENSKVLNHKDEIISLNVNFKKIFKRL